MKLIKSAVAMVTAFIGLNVFADPALVKAIIAATGDCGETDTVRGLANSKAWGCAGATGVAMRSTANLDNSISVFAERGRGTVAFLGGSITAMNGYRPLMESSFRRRFPETEFTFVNAGLPSTCSTAGAFRFVDDVLARGVPDLMFVEFAVNDDGDAHHSYSNAVRGMEGIVRHLWTVNPNADVIMMLMTAKNIHELELRGEEPTSYKAHHAVAERYGIPVVDIGRALAESEQQRGFGWEQYKDCHPTPEGNRFVADVLEKFLDSCHFAASVRKPTVSPHLLPDPLDGGSYCRAGWLRNGPAVRLGVGWNFTRPDWQNLTFCRWEHAQEPIFWSDRPGALAEFDFDGTAFAAYILAGSDAGALELSVDGGPFVRHELFRKWSNELQYPYVQVLASDLPEGRHTAVVRVGTRGAQGGTAVRLFRVGAQFSEQGRYALRDRIVRKHPLVRRDCWHGFDRNVFLFREHEAWVVEPETRTAGENRWTWTMQWADAFVERTGVPELLKQGWHHVALDVFDERMSDAVLPTVRAFQSYLAEELGLSSTANLIGMSWGGFFSVRYAVTFPSAVGRLYLDAPLLTFDGCGFMSWTGPWKNDVPACGWTDDPRMPINMAEQLAAARIPVLLLYGGQDQTVVPCKNAEAFVSRFKAAGGSLDVEKRELFGHHPHGLDDPSRIVSFFLESPHGPETGSL